MEHYDVYGVGNALVDIVTEVDHSFFQSNEVEKGVMTLVDEHRQHVLMKAIDMKRSKMSCGGSAGNTVIAVNQFGGKSYYSCLVAHDELGKFFLEDLRRNGVETNLRFENTPEGITGKCLVMTSPDAERTMNTFLGISSFLSPEHLDEGALSRSSYVYLEGYLVASPKGLEAMKMTKALARKHGVKVALTFSDPSMVRYFSGQMEEIVGDGLDLLFCNEEEALTFTGSDSLEDAREKLRQRAARFAITLGANGALVFDGQSYVEVEPFPARAIDTNGAGDMFAGAFLYAICKGHSYVGAGRIASLASARIVSQRGPRMTPAEAREVLRSISI